MIVNIKFSHAKSR